MKLYYSATSPYVRKVMAVAIETGLLDRMKRDDTAASPIAPNPTLNAGNPLGKVPCLETDDGMQLFDSPVICEYLDCQHSGNKLFPASGPQRWTALRRQALADGILDAALLARYETALRPAELQWSDWAEGQKAKITRGLDAFEAEAAQLRSTVDIGTLSLACALGYLDFRFAADGWRNGRTGLTEWFRRVLQATLDRQNGAACLTRAPFNSP